MRIETKLMPSLLILMLLSAPALSLEAEERVKLDVTFYSNESDVSVDNVSIVESRQISAFSQNADHRFRFVDSKNQTIKTYYRQVSFRVFNESFGGQEHKHGEQEHKHLENVYVDGKTEYTLYTDYFESAKNLEIYEEESKVAEVNLKKEICGENPCHEFCSDVINQSELDSCESYDGFNQTDDEESPQGQENKPLSNQAILIIILALVAIFTSAIYYRRSRNSEEE